PLPLGYSPTSTLPHGPSPTAPPPPPSPYRHSRCDYGVHRSAPCHLPEPGDEVLRAILCGHGPSASVDNFHYASSTISPGETPRIAPGLPLSVVSAYEIRFHTLLGVEEGS